MPRDRRPAPGVTSPPAPRLTAAALVLAALLSTVIGVVSYLALGPEGKEAAYLYWGLSAVVLGAAGWTWRHGRRRRKA